MTLDGRILRTSKCSVFPAPLVKDPILLSNNNTKVTKRLASNTKLCIILEQDANATAKNDGSVSGIKLEGIAENSLMKKESSSKKIHNYETNIPVEVDDDDTTEVSMLVSPAVETPQKNMFANLQPERTVVDKMCVNEILEKEKSMYIVEENVSNFLQYESKDGKDSVDNLYDVEDIYVENNEESVLQDEALFFLQDESKIFEHSLVEVGRRLWTSTMEKQHYTKGCLWSPDGTCLLVPVHLDGMHVMELPTDLYTTQKLQGNRDLTNLTSAVHVKEGGTVYDCSWYPYMNSSDPASCCWLATRQHEPIHMWDAFSGELRCSYRGYDNVDEVESAISVVFSNDGQKVIGGFKTTIKVFDTNIPGRDCDIIPVKKAVSCFTLTTDNDNCVTAGTWAGYINHYDLRAPKLGSLFTLGGHSGGITWLKYSPNVDKSWYLFSGARKDGKILQWDMRNYTEPIKVFQRTVETNQRIYYDLTPFNNWLASGDTDGLLRIWNLCDEEILYELPLHQDCCNGVSFHPSLPIISTSSGQYHFGDVAGSDDKHTEKIVNYENSVLMLWYGQSERYID